MFLIIDQSIQLNRVVYADACLVVQFFFAKIIQQQLGAVGLNDACPQSVKSLIVFVFLVCVGTDFI